MSTRKTHGIASTLVSACIRRLHLSNIYSSFRKPDSVSFFAFLPFCDLVGLKIKEEQVDDEEEEDDEEEDDEEEEDEVQGEL